MLTIQKHYYIGYVILPCFTVRGLKGTQGPELTCSDFLAKVFEIFFAPFWQGKIVVTGGEFENG